eukprot:4831756-Alexandrium_andersonii.AAC.1
MEAAGMAQVRAGSQARFLTLIAQSGVMQMAVRQRMRPGVSMPGARANRATAANWGRAAFPLHPGALRALQALVPPLPSTAPAPSIPVYRSTPPE